MAKDKNASPASQAAPEEAPRPKKVSPITLEEFREHAKPLSAVIDGEKKAISVKEFSTGSYGWYHTGKQVIEIGGIPVEAQVGITVTVIGSKPQG